MNVMSFCVYKLRPYPTSEKKTFVNVFLVLQGVCGQRGVVLTIDSVAKQGNPLKQEKTTYVGVS